MALQTSLNSILVQIAQNEKFKSPKFAIDHSPNHGYLANVNTITLKDTSSDKVLHLFSKRMPENVSKEFLFIFRNEVVFYSEIMKAFSDVNTAKIELPLVPKTYYLSEGIIIMENLIESGFEIWNPLNKLLDTAHVKAVLAAYGKLHAFSFALKQQNMEKFHSLGDKYDWFQTNHERLMNIGYYKNFVEKLADAFDMETESKYIEAVACFLCQGQVKYFEELLKADTNDVFIHGDNWTHNFMFRNNPSDKSTPKEVCLLDFQLVRKSLTVVDLSYFLATCACTKEVFDSITEYLKTYHDSLQANLKLLNCPTDVYTWETFQDEWKTFSVKGMVMSAIVSKMMIADKDELAARKDQELPMMFDFISRNEHLYHERMRIVIKYFYDSGILLQWLD